MSNLSAYRNYVNHVAEVMNDQVDYKVDATWVEKPNDTYYGLRFLIDENMGLCFYMHQEYEDYQSGKTISQTVAFLKEVINNERKKMDAFDEHSLLENLSNYEFIKERLVVEAVNFSNNEEFLEFVPHQTIGDVSCVYRVVINDFSDKEKRASFVIRNDMLKQWHISEDQLHYDAVNNSMKVEPITIKEFDTMGLPEAPFKICTTPNQMNGSGVLFYENFGEVIDKNGLGDCYIIPSSVHELLLCPKSKGFDPDALTDMLVEVNATQVDIKEQLANHIFEYDSKSKEVIPLFEESLDISLAA